jgi:exodeoxyribonuclease VIII
MHNLMLDIETLGTGPEAIVTSIGAVFFDPHSGQVGAEFYRELNFQDQIDIGRKPTQSTIQFWFSQPREAQGLR